MSRGTPLTLHFSHNFTVPAYDFLLKQQQQGQGWFESLASKRPSMLLVLRGKFVIKIVHLFLHVFLPTHYLCKHSTHKICSVAMDADVDKVITLSEFCKAHTLFCKITSLCVVFSRAESEHEFND
ncbi:putative bromodomain protein [Trichinella spiralis]|uniref:putative bromodomain protein n=1 Tax=Trichinella spiralis TaxID=6334 RepID=UPI0001EFC87C|nr:putative bromodomain protein [Trichinella spiralis]